MNRAASPRACSWLAGCQERLSLPGAAGSLLPSRGGPQSPMSDALTISPSCCSSSPPAAPGSPECCFCRRWGKKSFAERARPHTQGSSPNRCRWDTWARPLQPEGRTAPKRGPPLRRGLPGCCCPPLPPQLLPPRIIWGHLSPCLAQIYFQALPQRCPMAGSRRESSWVGRGAPAPTESRPNCEET